MRIRLARTASLRSPTRSRRAWYFPLTGCGAVAGHRAKPSWCFVVRTTSRAPAVWQRSAMASRSAPDEASLNVRTKLS